MKKIILVAGLIPAALYAQTPAGTDSLHKKTLKDVIILQRNNGNEMQELNPIRTEKMTQVELRKNACCNLAESFESNPSVEVSFTNPLAGVRQIQMLGLSGIYVQTMTDLLPTVRGLNYTYGFSNIPGPFVQSIFINKGPGSVTNGFESMTGQIDIELVKPEKSPRLFINAYVNSRLRTELNLIGSRRLNKYWSTNLLVHGSEIQHKVDMNKDHYMDRPLYKQGQFIQRWKFEGHKVEAMMGLKGLYDNKAGGDVRFDPHANAMTQPYYGFGNTTKRGEAFLKTSYSVDALEGKSLGLQMNYVYHDANGFYGRNQYTSHQQSLFANLIYQTPLGGDEHHLRAGGGFLYDAISEIYQDQLHVQQYTGSRNEPVAGLFAEYTFTPSKTFSLLAGLRGDYNMRLHRYYGIPRLHVKYMLTEKLALRLSGGSGFRTANVLTENAQILASNRQIIQTETLKPEYSWNVGGNLTYLFKEKKSKKEGRLSLDVFKTIFRQQTVVDLDQSPQYVVLSNLHGASYAWYIQAEVYKELVRNLDIRLAYKYNDVRMTQHGQLMEKTLNARHKALLNLSYETRNRHWKLDQTTQWVGPLRLPDYRQNPENLRLPSNAPAYFRLLGQITYSHQPWEIYAGCENWTNYTQKQIILDADHPFGSYFDAGSIWGPVLGRMFYTGMRYTIK